jgi:EAL domain-containing protein (putative c-di-GMP-specific phosphodiesterase class I)/CheY-like chemotaxis protein
MQKILVVEDNEAVLRTTLRMLKYQRYEAVGVTTIHDARTTLARQDFSLILVDHQLPDGWGINLLEDVAETHPTMGRVLATAFMELPLAVQAVNGGAVAQLLEKPFSRDALVDAVKNALAASTSEADATENWNPGRPAGRAMLQEVLTGGHLRLALQPIVTAAGGETVGYEALIRSTHGVLDGPRRILDLAEEVGMMRHVSQAVLARATEWLFRLPDGPSLFVNLHPLELEDMDALAARLEPLQDWSDRIVLEITGACLQRWRRELPQKLGRLRDLCFGFALDDLGAGQGALVLLAEAEPRFVKIDMSIVRGVHLDSHKRKMVELFAGFAMATGARLVAEGVEEADEAEVLRHAGVPLMQGYLFGRPSTELVHPAA